MKNGKQIHQLIGRLSKSDKRAFKLYLSTYKSTKEQKAIKLFDLFNRMKEYDESKLYKVSSKNNLSYDLHRLRNLLINALCDFKYNNGNLDNPGEIINRIELGFEYNLTELIKEGIKKGNDWVENNQGNIFFNLLFLEYQQKLNDKLKDIESIIESNSKILKTCELVTQAKMLYQMWAEVFNWYRKEAKKDHPQPLVFSDPKLLSLFNGEVETHLNFKQKRQFLKTKAMYYEGIQDMEYCLKTNQQILDLYFKHKENLTSSEFLSAIYNVVLNCLSLGKSKKAKEVSALSNLINNKHITEKYEIKKLQTFQLMLDSLIMLHEQDYKSIIQLEPEIEKWYQAHHSTFDKTLANNEFEQFVLFTIIANFKDHNYLKCLEWIIKAKSIDKQLIRAKSYHQTIIQFLELYCHFELNNHQLLPSLLKSIAYSINEKKYQLNIEEEMLRLSNALIKKKPSKIDEIRFKKESHFFSYQNIVLPYLKQKIQVLDN